MKKIKFVKLILYSKTRNKSFNKIIKIVKKNNFLYDKFFIKKYLYNNIYKFIKINDIKIFNVNNNEKKKNN